MLKQFKLMSSCWSRTKIKQINIYIYMAKKNLISQYKVSMELTQLKAENV